MIVNISSLRQNIDNMGALDEFVAINIGVAAQFRCPCVGLFDHGILCPDLQGSGGAGLNTGRWLIDLQTGIAKIAFRDLVGFSVKLGYAERTGGDTGLTANALVGMHTDRAKLSMVQSAGGANLDTGCIGAVHAAVLTEKPVDLPVFLFVFLKTDQGPGVRLKIRWILVTAEVFGPFGRQFVPLFASHLTATTGSTAGQID